MKKTHHPQDRRERLELKKVASERRKTLSKKKDFSDEETLEQLNSAKTFGPESI